MMGEIEAVEPKIGETWMVTKACKEHRGVEHCGKPWTFKADPALRCRCCVWERVLGSMVYGPETFSARDEAWKAHRPKIITLCGSTRFTAEMLDEAWRLTLEGNIVIHWNILNGEEAFSHGAEREGGDVKERIDALYLHKVRMADEVRVLNVGGYIGESTAREVAYAFQWGKVVTWLRPDLIPDARSKLEVARAAINAAATGTGL
jgi:hypothetical protein